MKRPSLLGTILICLLVLSSCARQQHFPSSRVNESLLQEAWLQQMNTDPNQWVRGVDRWYYSGEPGQLTRYAVNTPLTADMTDMIVRVPSFNGINIQGDFRVQIMGRQEYNSVEILGPNAATRQIAVTTRNHMLYLSRSCQKDCSQSLRSVIVRIGIQNLRTLIDTGRGDVTGKEITSDALVVNSKCSGRILLSGNMNVCQIKQTGSGTVTILGAYAPSATILAAGFGTVNVSGRVGVQSISNSGMGRINIIGADSNRLVVNASGASVTKVAGYVNLKKLNATDSSRVYIYWVNSNGLYVNQSGSARVGLAGCVTNFNLDMAGATCFQGQYLHAGSIYVRTHDASHANVTADQKIFAEAADNSSIYFFGSPNIVSRFISDNATIIPVWTNSIATPPMPMRQPYNWSFKGETSGAYTTPYRK